MEEKEHKKQIEKCKAYIIKMKWKQYQIFKIKERLNQK